MRVSLPLIAALGILLSSCGSQPKQPSTEAPKSAAETAPPVDAARHFPSENLVDTKVVPKALLDKPFMPGGTVGHYKKGKTEYDMFAGKMGSPLESAIVLSDWTRALTDPKFIASFGGYFGKDAGRPVFVFTKGPWIAGVAGLPEKDADAQARVLAARLN